MLTIEINSNCQTILATCNRDVDFDSEFDCVLVGHRPETGAIRVKGWMCEIEIIADSEGKFADPGLAIGDQVSNCCQSPIIIDDGFIPYCSKCIKTCNMQS